VTRPDAGRYRASGAEDLSGGSPSPSSPLSSSSSYYSSVSSPGGSDTAGDGGGGGGKREYTGEYGDSTREQLAGGGDSGDGPTRFPALPTLFTGALWVNDFWGQNLTSAGSHKSWRPLTAGGQGSGMRAWGLGFRTRIWGLGFGI